MARYPPHYLHSQLYRLYNQEKLHGIADCSANGLMLHEHSFTTVYTIK